MSQRAGPPQRSETLRRHVMQHGVPTSIPHLVLSLPGNIRVFCRVRPVSQEEQDSVDTKAMLSFDSDDDAILYLSNKGKIMTFELDKVFPPHASQEEVGPWSVDLLPDWLQVVCLTTPLSDWSFRCSRRSNLWSLPVSTALTSASSPTDRLARGKRTPWRYDEGLHPTVSSDRF